MSIRPGLERIEKLMEAVGNPHKKYKVIHVAGTNGKGSTCTFIQSILKEQGFKVGMFSSPHLYTPRDSIGMNGVVIEESVYQEAKRIVNQANDQHLIDCSPFELITGTAFMALDLLQVEIAVIEVGMGGLLDSTNVIPPPLVAVITVIGRDHAEFLGTDIESIARHKAGIIKPNTRVVVSEQHFDCMEVFRIACAKNSVKMIECKRAESMEEGCVVVYNGESITVPKMMAGDYQLVNVETAVRTVEVLNQLGYSISSTSIRQGIMNARIPGRLEWIESPYGLILVDGAHNLDGCHVLSEYLEKVPRPIAFIFNLSGSKEPQHFLDIVVREDDDVYVVPFSQPEGMPWIKAQDPSIVAERVSKSVKPCSSIEEALKQIDRTTTPTVVVFGSLYLIAELYRLFNIPI